MILTIAVIVIAIEIVVVVSMIAHHNDHSDNKVVARLRVDIVVAAVSRSVGALVH